MRVCVCVCDLYLFLLSSDQVEVEDYLSRFSHRGGFDERAETALRYAAPAVQEAVVRHSEHALPRERPSQYLVATVNRMSKVFERSSRRLPAWGVAEWSRRLAQVESDRDLRAAFWREFHRRLADPSSSADLLAAAASAPAPASPVSSSDAARGGSSVAPIGSAVTTPDPASAAPVSLAPGGSSSIGSTVTAPDPVSAAPVSSAPGGSLDAFDLLDRVLDAGSGVVESADAPSGAPPQPVDAGSIVEPLQPSAAASTDGLAAASPVSASLGQPECVGSAPPPRAPSGPCTDAAWSSELLQPSVDSLPSADGVAAASSVSALLVQPEGVGSAPPPRAPPVCEAASSSELPQPSMGSLVSEVAEAAGRLVDRAPPVSDGGARRTRTSLSVQTASGLVAFEHRTEEVSQVPAGVSSEVDPSLDARVFGEAADWLGGDEEREVHARFGPLVRCGVSVRSVNNGVCVGLSSGGVLRVCCFSW